MSDDAHLADGARHPLVSMRGITKRFGAVRALIDIDLDVHAGEVVALVGDNGAGKSTLAKVLSGVFRPDAGTIRLNGAVVQPNSTGDALALGVATVFQDLALCENLDVVANLWLGREINRRGVLDRIGMEQRSWDLLRELNARVPSVRARVSTLSAGQRQTVAIARSLIGEPDVVILDEPTAALGVAQSTEVLNLIESMRERGLGVLIISHNITDVQAISDRIEVLRLGRNNGSFRTADVTNETIISAITGAREYVG
jgi:D-xylose transport system ATP-binding protein